MDEATLFKFGKWVEYGRVHPRGEKFPLKGGSLDHVTLFKIFKSPSIFLEWMKLHSLNLASRSTTVSATLRVKKSPRKGRSLGHVIVLGVKPLFKFRNCIDYSECHTMG